MASAPGRALTGGPGKLSSYFNFFHHKAPSGKQAKKLDNFSFLTYIPRWKGIILGTQGGILMIYACFSAILGQIWSILPPQITLNTLKLVYYHALMSVC